MGRYRNKHSQMVSKAVASRHTSKKQLYLSVVSLILAFLILISATYCWYALANGKGEGNNLTLTAGNGLRVNDLGDTTQRFKDDSVLLPASSVDGRNLFFPTDGTDFSNETTKMTFRSANAGDRNYDYVQLDFNLTAEANYTSIYLDKSTSLKIEVPDDASAEYVAAAAKAEKALRTAIYYEGMDKPVVFTSQMNPCSVNAVKDIDRTTGRFLEHSTQVAVPFKDYSYGKNQLAMLNQGETRPFSLIIWLEGTDANCTSANVMLKQLVLNLKFTTSWDNTVDIHFDATGTDAASILEDNPQYTLVLNYNNTSHKINNMQFTMQKESANTKWKCSIPDNAHNDLTFMILDGSNNNSKVYEWTQTKSGGSTLNRGTATTFYVDSVNGTDSRGHWHDGDIEDHGEGHDSGIIDNDDW
ncbi:MAG: hypothetical protein UH734_04095 [Ruminococcus sp.]|nr:hypothetical protein [Ruminococcus sp.]